MPTFDQYVQDEFAPDNKYVQDEFVPDNIPDNIRNLSQKPATQEHEDEEEKHLINKFIKLNKDQLIQELLEIEQEKSDAVHSGSKNSEDEQDNDNVVFMIQVHKNGKYSQLREEQLLTYILASVLLCQLVVQFDLACSDEVQWT